MNPILRNTLCIIAGIILGSVVNMSIVNLGSSLIPAPAGVDTQTTEGLTAGIHLFEPKHYLFPFLAHALGTLVGAWLAIRLSAGKPLYAGLVVALLFFAGGAFMVFILPSPMWFNITDLVLAYFPMAWLGWKAAGGGK
jgi:hypothetical protein